MSSTSPWKPSSSSSLAESTRTAARAWRAASGPKFGTTSRSVRCSPTTTTKRSASAQQHAASALPRPKQRSQRELLLAHARNVHLGVCASRVIYTARTFKQNLFVVCSYQVPKMQKTSDTAEEMLPDHDREEKRERKRAAKAEATVAARAFACTGFSRSQCTGVCACVQVEKSRRQATPDPLSVLREVDKEAEARRLGGLAELDRLFGPDPPAVRESARAWDARRKSPGMRPQTFCFALKQNLFVVCSCQVPKMQKTSDTAEEQLDDITIGEMLPDHDREEKRERKRAAEAEATVAARAFACTGFSRSQCTLRGVRIARVIYTAKTFKQNLFVVCSCQVPKMQKQDRLLMADLLSAFEW